jgi:hypothetical protein
LEVRFRTVDRFRSTTIASTLGNLENVGLKLTDRDRFKYSLLSHRNMSREGKWTR